MCLVDSLVQKVKPELNHIYTEPPFSASGGPDLGWFCREHALHLYGLAGLMGLDARICIGDFVLLHPDYGWYTSVTDSSDHAWCKIEGSSPIDVSLTIRHLFPEVPDVALIHNDHPELASPFVLHSSVEEADSEFKKWLESKSPVIAYNEKGMLKPDILELHSNPYEFLFEPIGRGPRLTEVLGIDIFFGITFHCYRLVMQNARLLKDYRNSWQAMRGIARFATEAKEQMTKIALGA